MSTSTETLQIVATAKDQASATIKTLRSSLSSVGSQTGGPLGGLLSGLGGLNATSLLAGGGVLALAGGIDAVGTKIGDMIGSVVAAADAEQTSMTRLNTALGDNVTNWDGNTKAVETNIQKNLDYGFSADDLRTSLSTIVTATGNVALGFQGQTLAMDIARGRGIDLASASLLVAKVYSGNWKRAFTSAGLSSAGIQTSEQAIAYLTEKYAGQAENFANTTAGALDVMNAKMGQAYADIGTKLQPTMTKLAQTTTTVAVPAMENIADALGKVMGVLNASPNQQVGDLFSFLMGNIPGASGVLGSGKAILDAQQMGQGVVDAILAAQQTEVGAIHTMMGTAADTIASDNSVSQAAKLVWSQGIVSDTLAARDQAIAIWNKSARSLTGDMVGTLKSAKTDAGSAMKDLMWAINHPLAMEGDIAKVKADLASKKLAAGLASKNPEIHAAAIQAQSKLTAIWYSLDPAAAFAGSDAAATLQNDLNNGYPGAIADAKDFVKQYRAIIAGLNPGFLKSPIINSLLGLGGGRAAGGPTAAGQTYVVGERGPELLHMGNQSGYISPNSSGGHSHAIYLDGKKVGDAVDRHMGRKLQAASSAAYSGR